MKNSISLCYGSISFFINILHNVFLLYHVDVFVNVYKIDKLSFWIGEIIFLIWNSLNDPIFGWISDRKYLNTSKKTTNHANIIMNRLNNLHISGPLLSVTFMLFWLSWSFPAIQFVICLCLYDGFLTMIDLHHSALLADLSISTEIRTKLNMRCSIFSAFGSTFVFASYAVWDKNNFFPFQRFCFIVAVIALIGFYVSVKFMKKEICNLAIEYETMKDKLRNDNEDVSDDDKEDTTMIGKEAMKQFIKQLSGQSNFLWFAAMNLMQVFHCHFNSNFFPMFLAVLLGQQASPLTCSLLLGISFIAPHLNNVYFLVLCRKYGAYLVIKYLFFVKFLSTLLVYMYGRNHVWLLAFFIASNRVFTEGTCKLLTLVITDLVDEDVVVNQRSNSVSALIFGLVAFLSKPGQTFAPIIGTMLLTAFTGQDIFKTRGAELNNDNILSEDKSISNFTNDPIYQDGVFNLLIVVPLMCSVLQLFCWYNFTLHGKRLAFVKSMRCNFKLMSV